jgi:Icc-related predicted phosphoesterase
MKALLFSDLHCNNKQLANLYDFVIQNKEIDALIFAGDTVNMGEPVWFMEKFIKVIDELKLPFLWVPGNNDFGRAYYKLNARYKSLEGRIVKLELPSTNYHLPTKFTGVGGSPASWAGQYEGESMIDKKAIAGSIFVSHVPPPGILVLQQKDLAASDSRKKLADSPLVHICGHLHSRWGTAFLGQTKVIQLASLETGHYAILDLETLAVKFERF